MPDQDRFKLVAQKPSTGTLRTGRDMLLGASWAPLTDETGPAIDQLVSAPIIEQELTSQQPRVIQYWRHLPILWILPYDVCVIVFVL